MFPSWIWIARSLFTARSHRSRMFVALLDRLIAQLFGALEFGSQVVLGLGGDLHLDPLGLFGAFGLREPVERKAEHAADGLEVCPVVRIDGSACGDDNPRAEGALSKASSTVAASPTISQPVGGLSRSGSLSQSW